jgi:hypothetical protein
MTETGQQLRRYNTIDFVDLTPEGHAMIAAALLPRVMAILESGNPTGAEAIDPDFPRLKY